MYFFIIILVILLYTNLRINKRFDDLKDELEEITNYFHVKLKDTVDEIVSSDNSLDEIYKHIECLKEEVEMINNKIVKSELETDDIINDHVIELEKRINEITDALSEKDCSKEVRKIESTSSFHVKV